MVDPRNWSGSGHRSVDNMFINLMQALYLNDEEFAAAVAEREAAIAAGRRSRHRLPGLRGSTTLPAGAPVGGDKLRGAP